jgi:hypothetical protein
MSAVYNFGLTQSQEVCKSVTVPTPCALCGSLLYFLVLGGIEGKLGTMQTQGRSDVQSTSSRADLVQGAVPL